MHVIAQRVARRFIAASFHRTIVAFGVNDLKQLMKKGRRFGVISAYRANLSKHENQQRHGQLIADLQSMGLRNVHEMKSQWEDMATGVTHKEKSIFIPRIGFKFLCELGAKYDQDAVLYKDPSETIGIYDKHGKATMAFDPAGNPAVLQSLERSKEYSHGRSMSFGLVIDNRTFNYGGYSGGHPITMDMIEQSLSAHPM